LAWRQYKFVRALRIALENADANRQWIAGGDVFQSAPTPELGSIESAEMLDQFDAAAVQQVKANA
jgi:hypothetical protein